MISFYPGYFGWLGNQMFQYAATFAESKKVGTSCSFPENKPNLFTHFLLSSETIAYTQGEAYKESTFHYTELPHKNDITLFGYFQSEKYFLEYKEELKAEFTLRNHKYPETLDDEYIGIHVRRGDYLKHPDCHPTCSMEYYEKALSLLPNKPVKVFSDDYDWCCKNFKGDRYEISNGDFIEDFELLSKCSYHIIANSSFSWWAAWLSNSKKVIAPKRWFGSKYASYDTKDLYPEDWILV
tara:strand:+ start:268 stop:984 length:717 start_codon:yes stop_codon:yes gene_type:complete